MAIFREQVRAMLAKVPTMTEEQLVTTRKNAVAKGTPAQALVAAIDERLSVMQAPSGMALYRLAFARHMLGLMAQRPRGKWVRSIALVKHTMRECPDNPYVPYVAENSPRLIPLTKTLAEALPAFPALERRKDGDGQSAPVFYLRREG